MVSPASEFGRDDSGAAMVEMAIVLPLLLILLLGFVDFGYAFYQWNGANKAVQAGARLAEVSDPIASGVALEGGTPSNTLQVGSVVPVNTYDYVCVANAAGTASCSCAAGTCQGLTVSTTGQAAFNLIYGGDPVVAGQSRRPGMVDFFPFLRKQNLQVEYIATGLGYWTRPGGPVPTIRVSIVNHPFQFFFLGGLLGFANITMPTMLSTVTGEDLKVTYP